MRFAGILVGVILAAAPMLCAQNARIDSLNALLAKTTNNPRKIELLNQLVSETWDYSFDKALAIAQQAYDLAELTKDVRGLAYSGTSVGMYYYFKSDYATAKRYYWTALKILGDSNYSDVPGFTLIRLGNLYRVQGQFDSSRWYYDKALISLKDHEPGVMLASLYYNLGLLEVAQAEFVKAEEHLQTSLAIRSRLKDSLLMAENWRALGSIYKDFSDFKKARTYYDLTYRVARSSADPELTMFCEIYIGELDFLEGNYTRAMKRCAVALEMLKEHDFRRYHAVVLQLIGRVLDAQGEYDRAMEMFINSLKLDEAMNSQQTAARTRGMMAWVHIRQRHDSLALHYARQSLTQCENLKDREGIAFANNVLGYIHYVQQKYEPSLAFFVKAYSIRKELGLLVLCANTLFNMSRVYKAQGNDEKAVELLLNSLEIDRETQAWPGVVTGLNELGAIYLKQKQLKKAEKYLLEAQLAAKRINARLYLRDNYRLSAELAKAQHQPEKANRYYEKFIALNDSLFNAQNAERIAQLNALYELDKKEKEIQVLNVQRELNQNQIAAQQAQLRWQNAVLMASAIGVVLLLAFSFVLYRYYKDKSKSAKDLTRLNRDLKEKNEEVLAQSEELTEANRKLIQMNRDIVEQKEEIQAQSEELIEANETISSINRNLEVAVDERTSQLKEAYRELDTFFYRASHDFRRPLTTFMGLAEVASITVKDQNALELFDKMKETARNLDKMLNKLQSVSTVGESEAVYREIFFQTEVERVYDIFKEELLHARMQFSANINVTRKFKSYPGIIHIILVNLIENSIHFATPAEPRVQIDVFDRADNLIIKVSDNGEGIREEYQSKVFDMYFRASEKSKGNGLGLYIVRKSIEKLNGTIQLESRHAQGATFTVTLPCQG